MMGIVRVEFRAICSLFSERISCLTRKSGSARVSRAWWPDCHELHIALNRCFPLLTRLQKSALAGRHVRPVWRAT